MNIGYKLKAKKLAQRGFTLIELMISMVIGLIILSAVIGMFVSMIKADNDYLKSVRLNQELRSVMSLITRDLRRAGANQNSAVNSSTTPPTNPFSIVGSTRLMIGTPGPTTGTSISFSYDAVNDSIVEQYGYRINIATGTERIESCSGLCNVWNPVTDESLVKMTGLTFTDTTTTEAGINIRQITVTISGQLQKDGTVARTMTETIKVRNDEI
jgi:prepilin peptidase dependent protein B